LYERGHFYIGGEWVESLGGGVSEVISPSTEQFVGRAPSGSIADIDRAVAAAKDAFDCGPWRKLSWHERIGILAQVNKAMNERGPEIAELSALQSGRDPKVAAAAGARNPYQILFDHYLEVLREIHAGFVSINGYGSHLTAPMGGMKESGIGREHGPEGFSEFLEYKSITISPELADLLTAERASPWRACAAARSPGTPTRRSSRSHRWQRCSWPSSCRRSVATRCSPACTPRTTRSPLRCRSSSPASRLRTTSATSPWIVPITRWSRSIR
jgi:hypothetical protein